jgi:hypothetical protein
VAETAERDGSGRVLLGTGFDDETPNPDPSAQKQEALEQRSPEDCFVSAR